MFFLGLGPNPNPNRTGGVLPVLYATGSYL